MTTAYVDAVSAQATLRGRSAYWLRTWMVRLAEMPRRYEEQRMLCVVHELDHPGVLADLQVARGPFRA